jgi:hypothetical protein
MKAGTGQIPKLIMRLSFASGGVLRCQGSTGKCKNDPVIVGLR